MFTDIIFFFFLPVKPIGSHVPCSVVDSALITQYIKSEKKKDNFQKFFGTGNEILSITTTNRVKISFFPKATPFVPRKLTDFGFQGQHVA